MEQKEKKVVLITGCSSGIGLETAIALSKLKDYIVYATLRNISNSGTLLTNREKVQPCEGQLHLESLDVTDENSIQKCVNNIITKEKKIDILVNNAGVALAGFAETTEDEQIEKIFDINFMGVVRMFRAVLPFMRSRKSGHIISISSTSAVSPPTGLGFYAASKAALETFHSSEAPILAQWNIKLTILQVGTTITNDTHMAEKVDASVVIVYHLMKETFISYF